MGAGGGGGGGVHCVQGEKWKDDTSIIMYQSKIGEPGCNIGDDCSPGSSRGGTALIRHTLLGARER